MTHSGLWSRAAKISFQHHCELPEYVDQTLPTPAPYAPVCQKIFYHMRKMFTIYETYESQQYFRSHASFHREKVRHLSNPEYKHIIHPFSIFVKREHMVMSFVWLFLFFYNPMFGSFFADIYIKERSFVNMVMFYSISAVYSVIVMGDIVMRFFLGYTIDKTREIVLDRKRIIKHYLCTYFMFDFLPLVVFVVQIVFHQIPYRYKLIFFQLTSLRQFRMKTCMEGINQMLRIMRCKRPVRVSFIIYLVFLIMVHWWTCVFKVINLVRKEFNISHNGSWFDKVELERQRSGTLQQNRDEKSYVFASFIDYLQYMNIVLCHFLGAGIGNYKTSDPVEQFVLAILLIFSLTVYLLSLAMLLQYFGVANASEFKFEETLGQVQEYMVMKRFPRLLRKRINKYYDYKFNKKFFSEKQILGTLTEHLQMEILLYSCQNMINKVQLFKGLSKGAVGCILAFLKQEIYLSNDIVMSANDDTGTLYFILFGTCAIQLASGKEAMHIEDGSLFGENKEFAKGSSLDFSYSVVAIEPCEIYSLAAEDIKYCCRHYPEIKNKIEIMSTVRSSIYATALTRAAMEDAHISASDIVAELRRGRILQQRRKRTGALRIVSD